METFLNHVCQLKADFDNGDEHAALEIVNLFGGPLKDNAHINTEAFEKAANLIVEMENEIDLKTVLMAVSKGNIEVAAAMLQDMYERADVQFHQIRTLLCGREATIENFTKVAKLIFEAK